LEATDLEATALEAAGLAAAPTFVAGEVFAFPLVLAVALLTGLVREGVFDAVRAAPEGVTLAIARAVYRNPA
jgi:hypothetical protein